MDDKTDASTIVAGSENAYTIQTTKDKLIEIEDQVDNHDTRIADLETELDNALQLIQELDNDLSDLLIHVENIISDVDVIRDELDSKLNNNITNFYSLFDKYWWVIAIIIFIMIGFVK